MKFHLISKKTQFAQFVTGNISGNNGTIEPQVSDNVDNVDSVEIN